MSSCTSLFYIRKETLLRRWVITVSLRNKINALQSSWISDRDYPKCSHSMSLDRSEKYSSIPQNTNRKALISENSGISLTLNNPNCISCFLRLKGLCYWDYLYGTSSQISTIFLLGIRARFRTQEAPSLDLQMECPPNSLDYFPFTSLPLDFPPTLLFHLTL